MATHLHRVPLIAALAAALAGGSCARPVAEGAATGASRPGRAPLEDDRGRFYLEDEVTSPVALAPGSRNPVYPGLMRSAGFEASVTAQFVVDTTGMIELSTFRLFRTTHTAPPSLDDQVRQAFETAVRDALPGIRFIPAQVAGRKVRQLVQQPFVFALQR
jgi:protein TonB